MKTFRLAVLAAACCAATQALACYTVYDRDNQIVYNAQVPPVDMSRPVGETLPAVFPGGHLVFGAATDCPRENQPLPKLRVTSSSDRSPLLTDAETARSLGLRHTMVGNVAVVPERPADMRPGVNLAESGLQAPDTRMMGAGPARPGTQAYGAPASGTQRGGQVITEMHNPPLTAVQPLPPLIRSR